MDKIKIFTANDPDYFQEAIDEWIEELKKEGEDITITSQSMASDANWFCLSVSYKGKKIQMEDIL